MVQAIAQYITVNNTIKGNTDMTQKLKTVIATDLTEIDLAFIVRVMQDIYKNPSDYRQQYHAEQIIKKLK